MGQLKVHKYSVIYINMTGCSKYNHLQERDEISYESYARIEHMLTGCWLHALKGTQKI